MATTTTIIEELLRSKVDMKVAIDQEERIVALEERVSELIEQLEAVKITAENGLLKRLELSQPDITYDLN